MDNLLEDVEKFIRRNFDSPDGKHFLVGVSGGTDSMVLLWSLEKLQNDLGFELSVVHFNYRRHRQASTAEQTVRNWCDDKEITYIGAGFRQPDNINKDRRGVEGTLRSVRYNYFEDVSNICHADGVFLAHHQDDQVETVLLNIGRGTGIPGLSGMKTKNKWGNMWLLRPLLGFPKAKLKSLADEIGLPIVDDPTNKQTKFTRNDIRHELLPLWSDIQKDPSGSIARLSKIAKKENQFWLEYLESEVKFWDWPSEIQVPREQFQQLHPAVQDRFLHRVPQRLTGHIKGWDQKNIQALRNLLDAHSGRRLDLPGQLKAIVEYSRMSIYKTTFDVDKIYPILFEEVDNTVDLGQIGTLRLLDNKPTPNNDTYVSEISIRDSSNIMIRTWTDGDRIQKNSNEMLIKRLFQDRKIPWRARRFWPIFTQADKIIGIPGFEMDTGVNDGNRTIWLEFEPTHPCYHQLVASG